MLFQPKTLFLFCLWSRISIQPAEAWSLLDTKFRRLLLIRTEPELLKLCKYFNFNESFFHVRIGFRPSQTVSGRKSNFHAKAFPRKGFPFPSPSTSDGGYHWYTSSYHYDWGNMAASAIDGNPYRLLISGSSCMSGGLAVGQLHSSYFRTLFNEDWRNFVYPSVSTKKLRKK